MWNPLINELDSFFEDSVPWAVDWLPLLETELSNFANTALFGMLSILLDIFLSILAVEINVTQIGGILEKPHSKNGQPLNPLYPSYPVYPIYLLYSLCPLSPLLKWVYRLYTQFYNEKKSRCEGP